MISPYTCTYREIWNDPRFWQRSNGAKLVYFYILTTPLGNGLGCFKAGMEAMIEDSRMTAKSFRESFGECLDNDLFNYDNENRVLLIPKYFERNAPNNPNGIIALGKEFVKIPPSPLKSECYQIVADWVENRKESFGQSFRESFGESMPKQPGTYSPSPSVSLSPSVSNKDTVRAPKPYTQDFETFWKAYPNGSRRSSLPLTISVPSGTSECRLRFKDPRTTPSPKLSISPTVPPGRM